MKKPLFSRLLGLLLAVIMVFTLCACGSGTKEEAGSAGEGEKPAASTEEQPAGETGAAGKETLTVAMATEPATLNPNFHPQGTIYPVINQICEGLMYLNDEGTLETKLL